MSAGSIISIVTFLVSIVITLLLAIFYPAIRIKACKHVYDLDTFFIGPLLGAIIVLATTSINFTVAMKGLWSFSGLNPVGIIILFFSMVLISQFLETTGFFEMCAMYAVNKAGKSGTRLFFFIYITVSILTVFTSNDVVVLTFTPFIHQFSLLTGIDPRPYLIGEFFAANTWSMIFIISNPTNVVLGTAFDVSFGRFVVKMLLPTLLGGISNCVLLYLIYRTQINSEFEIEEEEEDQDPKGSITSWRDMWVGIIILGITILCMAFNSIPGFPFEMWHVAGIFAVVVLVYMIVFDIISKDRPSKTLIVLSRLPIAILPFLLSLFILVNSLKINGIFDTIGGWIGKLVGGNDYWNILLYGVISTLAANFLNNIPMSVAFVPIIQAANNPANKGALFASIAGSNLGANLTPLGALAGLMWLRILKGYQIQIGFPEFMKIGFKITPITLLFVIGGLLLMFL